MSDPEHGRVLRFRPPPRCPEWTPEGTRQWFQTEKARILRADRRVVERAKEQRAR
jgi:hypothetical protein